MRLVDADALCTHIENEFDGVCVYDVSGNEAAREFCDMVDIAPTIDAIPVEWLRDMMLEREAEESRAAWLVMREWQKEQEAR
jgi:hypothetical protein